MMMGPMQCLGDDDDDDDDHDGRQIYQPVAPATPTICIY